uniref:Uncharacterized protein n=1 Tax=Avena sativa TaxID=4498 RepID=A0ACD5Z5Q7_AVESA
MAAQVPRAEDNFTIHRSWPADFMIVCSSRRVRDDIVAAGVVDGWDFSLCFSPWNRQLQAVRRSLRYHAHIELTGILAHAWNRATVGVLLGSVAWVERLGAATASREDLGCFQVVAWIDSINQLPPEKALLIEEPNDLMEEDDGLVLLGDALIPLEKMMLRYIVKIRLVRAEDMTVPDPPPGDEDDGGDGGDGGRDRGGGEGSVRGDGLSKRSGARPDSRMAPPGPRDGRGRSSQGWQHRSGGWGGSRRITIRAPLEVVPWPAVEVEDQEEDDVGDTGVEAHLQNLSGKSSQSHVSASFDQEKGEVVASPRGEDLADASFLANGQFDRGPAGSLLTPPARQPFPGRDSVDIFQTVGRRVVGSHVEDVQVVGATPEAPPDPEGEKMPGPSLEDCQLSSPGLLPSPEDEPDGTYLSKGSDQLGSPRSVLNAFDTFPVCLSSVDAETEQQYGPEAVDFEAARGQARSPAAFPDACKRPINSVLSRPVAKRGQCKKRYSGPVRRSGRIRGRFDPAIPIRQHQLTLITRLEIAREGELIGDEVLNAYLDLFARPLRQLHIDVVLRLFGWMPDALPLCNDAPVECLV